MIDVGVFSDTLKSRMATEILKTYYKDGEADCEVRKAIDGVKDNEFFPLITDSCKEGKSIPEMAQRNFICESLVKKYKKQLLLKVFESLEKQ